ncbi:MULTISPECIES: DUF4386 family protein [unclassified Pseudoalteromonas]|uniref:DUF4386 family protein n=1 Tax=unclassified Pseudoalteromonas TaxID=194690 RepID=UPI0030145037
MKIQSYGGVAAVTLAITYLFGFVLFFAVLDSSQYDTPEGYLSYFIAQRDTFFMGYIVIGIIFSFALLLLVQAIYRRFQSLTPNLSHYTAAVGYIWAAIVLSSTMIFLSSISAIAKFHGSDPEQALVINRTISIVVDALGGGIELVGAVWVLAISYAGIKHRVWPKLLHFWGVLVGVAGVLTLFSGLSFLTDNPFFGVTTAIFGLGQIVWFIALGIAMLKEQKQA